MHNEAVGRRVARLNGLKLTGSMGVLIRAKKEGFHIIMKDEFENLRSKTSTSSWGGRRYSPKAFTEKWRICWPSAEKR